MRHLSLSQTANTRPACVEICDSKEGVHEEQIVLLPILRKSLKSNPFSYVHLPQT